MASTVSNGNDRSGKWQEPFQMATTVYEREICVGVICGLSLLALYSTPRGFSLDTLVFPSPQKPTGDLICVTVSRICAPALEDSPGKDEIR